MLRHKDTELFQKLENLPQFVERKSPSLEWKFDRALGVFPRALGVFPRVLGKFHSKEGKFSVLRIGKNLNSF
jgi:hypothetical protein